MDALVPGAALPTPKVTATNTSSSAADAAVREAAKAATARDGACDIAEKVATEEVGPKDGRGSAAEASSAPSAAKQAPSSLLPSSSPLAVEAVNSSSMKSSETREAAGVSGVTLSQETDMRSQIRHVLDMCNDLGINKFKSGSVEASEVIENLDKFVIVDARNSQERNISMIPNSLAVEDYINEVKAAKTSLGQDDKEAVMVCAVGYLSAAYAANIQGALGRRSRRLNGGMLAYALHGYPLVRHDGVLTKSLHVFAEELADLIPLSSGITTVSYRGAADAMASQQEEKIADLMKV